MSYGIYFCRECCKFVAGPLAKCNGCGHEHTREHRALEEPPKLRRRQLRLR